MDKGTYSEISMQIPAFEKIKAGDEQAFSLLFKALYPVLCRYALRYLSEQHVVEELIQDVFFTLWSRRSTLEVHTSVKSYLFVALRNRIFSYFRDRLKNPAYPGEETEEMELHLGSTPPQVEEKLSAEDIQTLAQQAVASLPERCRVIFTLSRYQSMGYQEIAERLGISVKTVENQMVLALKKLRKALGDYL